MGLFSKRPEADGRPIVVGLGNPGERYAQTRHNAGAMVVALLADRMGAKLKTHRSGCLVAEGRVGGEPVVIARPTSYMNESGRPVRQLLDFYKSPLASLVLVHDEIDIPFGDVRIKAGGGTAGNNGVRSVASHLSSKDFLRVRVGVGRPRSGQDAAGHVLQRFSSAERAELDDLLGRAADAVELVVTEGPERAMNEVNTRS